VQISRYPHFQSVASFFEAIGSALNGFASQPSIGCGADETMRPNQKLSEISGNPRRPPPVTQAARERPPRATLVS
jgi:hypothetical protein